MIKLKRLNCAIMGTGQILLVATNSKGELVGTVMLKTESVVAQIRSLFVHPAYRRRGVGEMLMRQCEKIATRTPCTNESIALTVDKNNNIAGKLYRKLGYFITVAYSDGELVMAKRLRAPKRLNYPRRTRRKK